VNWLELFNIVWHFCIFGIGDILAAMRAIHVLQGLALFDGITSLFIKEKRILTQNAKRMRGRLVHIL